MKICNRGTSPNHNNYNVGSGILPHDLIHSEIHIGFTLTNHLNFIAVFFNGNFFDEFDQSMIFSNLFTQSFDYRESDYIIVKEIKIEPMTPFL